MTTTSLKDLMAEAYLKACVDHLRASQTADLCAREKFFTVCEAIAEAYPEAVAAMRERMGVTP